MTTLSKPPLEIVKEYFPDAQEEDLVSVLWACTGWPAFWDGPIEECMRKQLHKFSELSNKCPHTALQISDKEVDAQMRRYEAAKNQTIREWAYYAWEEAGRPENRADEFWHKAETQFYLYRRRKV